MQIKQWLKIFGISMVKNGCDQSGQGILKFFLKNEQMEEPVFCILTQIHKI